MTVAELEHWFNNVDLPKGPILLYPGTIVTDVRKFVDSHLTPLKLVPNAPTTHTHRDRLLALKAIIENN